MRKVMIIPTQMTNKIQMNLLIPRTIPNPLHAPPINTFLSKQSVNRVSVIIWQQTVLRQAAFPNAMFRTLLQQSQRHIGQLSYHSVWQRAIKVGSCYKRALNKQIYALKNVH